MTTEVTVVRPSDDLYPNAYNNIHHPPKRLYVLGKIPPGPYVSVVGSRKATSYGSAVVSNIVQTLVNYGVTIVSGLALGIDSLAHSAALEGGGKTIAILGSGVDRIYPASNQRLAERIIKNQGAIISEYGPGTPPLKHHFPQRNRLVSGISEITLVIEAAASSGSLITASLALDQGKDVMAIPGNINQPASTGCNNLIKNGAHVATSAEDVLDLLGINTDQPMAKLRFDSNIEKEIYGLLVNGPLDSEQINSMLNYKSSEIAQTLTMLEIKGILVSNAGKWFSKKINKGM